MRKILIIDADVELLQTLSNELSQAGYQVDTATTAQDGLAKAPYASLVILAVELPDQNGFVVCSNLKRNEQTKYIPVFITSSAETTTAFEQHLALPIHADGYFLKPLDMTIMLEELANIFAEMDAAAAEYYQAEDANADEMIDVGTKDDEIAADDDSEVIKALSLDDMNLFADIDSESFEQSDAAIFDNETVPPAPAPAPASAPAPAPASAPAPAPAPSPAPIPKPPVPSAVPTHSAPANNFKLPPVKPLSATASRASMNAVGPLPRPTLAPTKAPASASTARMPAAMQAPASSVSHPSIPAVDISRLSDEITVLNNEITALKSEITARDNRITALQSQCDALNSRCQNAEALVESLTAENAQLTEQINASGASQSQKDRMEQIAREILEITQKM